MVWIWSVLHRLVSRTLCSQLVVLFGETGETLRGEEGLDQPGGWRSLGMGPWSILPPAPLSASCPSWCQQRLQHSCHHHRPRNSEPKQITKDWPSDSMTDSNTKPVATWPFIGIYLVATSSLTQRWQEYSILSHVTPEWREFQSLPAGFFHVNIFWIKMSNICVCVWMFLSMSVGVCILGHTGD